MLMCVGACAGSQPWGTANDPLIKPRLMSWMRLEGFVFFSTHTAVFQQNPPPSAPDMTVRSQPSLPAGRPHPAIPSPAHPTPHAPPFTHPAPPCRCCSWSPTGGATWPPCSACAPQRTAAQAWRMTGTAAEQGGGGGGWRPRVSGLGWAGGEKGEGRGWVPSWDVWPAHPHSPECLQQGRSLGASSCCIRKFATPRQPMPL